jgi:hypothetical protein
VIFFSSLTAIPYTAKKAPAVRSERMSRQSVEGASEIGGLHGGTRTETSRLR